MVNNSTTTIEQLEQHITLDDSERTQISKIIDAHPMAVNPYYMDLIDWNDPSDPIRKMSIPSPAETELDGSLDTSGEASNTKIRGLQHKYRQTALILTTNNCAMYCRHCFRKRLVGTENDEIAADWDAIVSYLHEHKEITNVLLSGGDPLTMPTTEIASMLNHLSDIDHLNYVRIGSRTPVVIPSRITEDPELIKMLSQYSRNHKRLFINTQFNHPREITPDSMRAISMLHDAGIVINNQTVLLKGINDDAKVMAELQNRLVEVGVTPYYVFQCRPVKTVKRTFQLPLHRAIEIIDETKRLLDGIAKRFRFVMSHDKGKIEILGKCEGQTFFKYHQAKDNALTGTLFAKNISPTDCWLDL